MGNYCVVLECDKNLPDESRVVEILNEYKPDHLVYNIALKSSLKYETLVIFDFRFLKSNVIAGWVTRCHWILSP